MIFVYLFTWQRAHPSIDDDEDEDNIIDKATYQRLGGLLHQLQQSMPGEVSCRIYCMESGRGFFFT